jgi:methionyl-tRNA synthetase
MLGFKTPLAKAGWDAIASSALETHQALPEPHILFTKVEDDVIQKEIEKLTQMTGKNKVVPTKEQISIEDLRKLDLRVAKILSVERVPKSKKMLKLTVDLGTEQRTILSGIGETNHDISLLVGKQVLLVANLKPALLMGLQSQGLILSAEIADGFELPHFYHAKPGTSVT